LYVCIYIQINKAAGPTSVSSTASYQECRDVPIVGAGVGRPESGNTGEGSAFKTSSIILSSLLTPTNVNLDTSSNYQRGME
jgi:hypothetical protein